MKQLDCVRALRKLYRFSFSAWVHASPSNSRWSAEHSFLPFPLKKLPLSFPQNCTGFKSSPHECDCDMRLITIRKRIVHVTALFVQAEVACLQIMEKDRLVSSLPGKARSKQRRAIWYTLNFLQLTALSTLGRPRKPYPLERTGGAASLFQGIFQPSILSWRCNKETDSKWILSLLQARMLGFLSPKPQGKLLQQINKVKWSEDSRLSDVSGVYECVCVSAHVSVCVGVRIKCQLVMTLDCSWAWGWHAAQSWSSRKRPREIIDHFE